MTTSIIQTKSDIERTNTLLGKAPPVYRQAYSDRTSWLMACFSELAYKKFNPPVLNLSTANKLESILERTSSSKLSFEKIRQLVSAFAYDSEEEKESLIADLNELKAELLETFDSNGSQAILIRTSRFLVLSFRGTEATSWRDIKSDAYAVLKSCETGGKVHSGFDAAFNVIERDIINALEKFPNLPLFITGHSLGGALATIAAKRLTHKGGNAACYTFGSPRVADDHWLMTMKTPIYRVVNASDSVTMVPPADVLITSLSWLLGLLPGVGDSVKRSLREKFGKYLHGGDMRYLTSISPGDYKSTRLLYHVDIWYRFRGWLNNKLPWTSVLADHSISIYRKKLEQIALERNK
ncbi:lipase [Pseudidiomarina aquimaris]|uniref:Lipase n=1 Tax=Pseudidiomarina aquimaris TaxID=641841 RepID=A0A432XAP0_9GAMM|nr:lipase family protein [Pseudidiomarina aquimaris]RUO45811.1 lipase [Pseudidiomarina aquimaris]